MRIAFRALAAVAVTGGLVAGSARADTKGGVDAFIPAVPNPLPGAQSTTPALWGWIGNEHILVSQGYVNTLSGGNVTLNVAGRISFGTTAGSRATPADNFQPLNGFNVAGTGPLAVWPYANSWFGNIGLLVSLDYPAYLQAFVDDTAFNVGYDSAKAVNPPFFDQTPTGPMLTSGYTVGQNDVIQIDTKIKLLRSTARIEWTITNNDIESHTVGLRWTVNHRGSENGFYFVDPDLGESRNSAVYDGAKIPASIEVFGRRADSDANDAANPPFHSRHLFRGNGATEPTKVYVGDSIDLYPGEAAAPTDQYLPRLNRNPRLNAGVAVAAYYGGDTGYVLRPGETKTVVAYYGIGTSTENFDRRDVMVLGTEAPTALQYNADAANDPAVKGNTSPTIASIAPKFLTPNPFRIFASAYSQKPNDPLYDVAFKGSSLSVALPVGLRFANVPGSSAPDVASKTISGGSVSGTITGDQEGNASWYVEPTGEKFGPVAYTVSLGVSQPSLTMSVSRTINIPSVPLVELLPGKFQMIGFPFVFHPLVSNNGDPDTVVNSLTAPAEGNPTFYRWESDPNTGGTSGRWRVATKLETGTSYFYRPSISTGGGKRLIFLKGAQPTPFQAPVAGKSSIPTQLTIERGWNMVSNPYVYEVPLKSIRVVPLDDNGSLTPVPFSTAVQTGLIRGAIFYFNAVAGGYDFVGDLNQVLKPWQGYWIFSNTRAEIQFPGPTMRNSLVLPSTQTPDDLPSDAWSEPPTRGFATTDNWKLQLVARREDGRMDGATYIGVNTRGAADLPKPPAFQDFVDVRLTDSEGTGRFSQVLRRPGARMQWDVAVEGDADGFATLQWPGVQNLPKRVRLSILDIQTGARIDMRGTSSLRVPIRKGGLSRYRVIALTEATRRLAIAYLRPDGSGRAMGVYAFRLGTTQDATVDARIVTVTGKTISVLASGRSTSTDGTRLVWNGRNADGAQVPAGPYQLEVTVSGPDGSVARERRTISIIR